MTLRPALFVHGLLLSGRHRLLWQRGRDQFERGLLLFAWHRLMCLQHRLRLMYLQLMRLPRLSQRWTVKLLKSWLKIKTEPLKSH